MARRAKSSKGQAEPKRSPAGKPPTNDDARLRDLEKQLAESLKRETVVQEQQAAAAEILRVISSSPTDVQPVFEAIVESGRRLCEATYSAVFLVKDGQLVLTAIRGVNEAGIAAIHQAYPRPVARDTTSGRSILDHALVHLPDTWLDLTYTYPLRDVIGLRSILTVPFFRGGQPFGALSVWRPEPKPFTDKQVALLQTFADQAVIAIENVRLFNETKEALERQTATAEILSVISTSPTDVQPVFDVVAESAARLCDSFDAAIYRREADRLVLVGYHGQIGEREIGVSSLSVSRGTGAGRAVLERRAVHVLDMQAEVTDFPESSANARRRGFRALLSVPLIKDGLAIGAIVLLKTEARLFTDQQIALLRTFADQAVIAIENVRLFKELEARNRDLTEALDQQTATSEILRVISRSQTDVQPVFDTIVRSGLRLLGGYSATMMLLRDDDSLDLVAYTSISAEADASLIHAFPLPLRSVPPGERAAHERRAYAVEDVESALDVTDVMRETGRARGWRSNLFIPLTRDEVAIGLISITRREPGPFAADQIALMETFADQAVIAIENVRLFTELQEKNRALTEAHAQVTESLNRQTATSEILQVISQSPTEVQPVFETIVRNAVRLCGGVHGGVYRFDGQLVHSVAHDGYTPEDLESWQRTWPRPVTAASAACQAIRTKKLARIADIETAPELSNLSPEARANLLARGSRSVVAVPMRRQDDVIGAISVTHGQVDGFSDAHVELLKTFADQAVIAIENVRLFKELEERNRDLMATSAILQVISSSPTNIQPVFDAIVDKAAKLGDGIFSTLISFDGELMRLEAAHNWTSEAFEHLSHGILPAPPSRALPAGRAILGRTVIHLPDIELDQEFRHPELLRAVGFRSLLSVPMLRAGVPLGAISVARAEPGPFSDSQIDLLKTFADQAVIAVENVRLFKELQARTTELTQSVEQLTALGEVSRSVTSTLDVETVLETVVARARQLAGADGCLIYEYDEGSQQFQSRATDNLDAAYAEALRAAPLRKGEGVSGRAAEVGEAVQVADITEPSAYQSSVRDITIQAGYRAVLSVPLLREDEIIGSLILIRKTPGEFSAKIVELLKTFATQSALAIQNARLFREIEDKSRQLEAASQHKSEFLANMSHELRTPLNAVIGFSEVLSEGMFGEINEKQAEYLRDILESGRHLLSLINDILDLSKIEAGRMDLEAADFDLPSAIDNALILVRERANRRGITLGRTIDDSLGILRGDERKVKQVFLNLLSNALKFTPEGGRIDVRAAMSDGMVEVSVADTGVGIAPEDQEAIFEEFRQVGTADKKVEGTGLGLALSRRFVELHGGRIWVESAVGNGSTFTFRLPVGHGE